MFLKGYKLDSYWNINQRCVYRCKGGLSLNTCLLSFFFLKIFPSEEISALSQIRPGNTLRNKTKLLKGTLQHSGTVLGCLTCAWCLTLPLYYTLHTRAKLLPLNLGPQCISSLFQVFWWSMEKILFKSCWCSYESLNKTYYCEHILK